MKFLSFVSAIFCLFGYLNAASVSVNLRLARVCTTDILVNTNAAAVEYTSASASAVFKSSTWVRSALGDLNSNIKKFVTQAVSINSAYQTSTQYVAAIAMRDSLSGIIQSLRQAQSAAATAQVSNSAQITAEVNAVVASLESVRQALVQYTIYSFTLSFRLMTVVFPDGQCNQLADGILRTSQVLKTAIAAVSDRVRNDQSFGLLAMALDYQLAVQGANNAAQNVALATQISYFEATTSTSTQATTTLLNANFAIFDAYSTSIIVEFNGYGLYAQTAINAAIFAIRLQLINATVEEVYVPLGQEILTGLANAYLSVNDEFLVAITDCKTEVSSSTPGGNGSNSSNKSGASDGSNNALTPYSMKGEVKKCKKRGRGLLLDIQQQYSKSWNAAVCGVTSLNAIIARMSLAQTSVNSCVVQSVVDFRLVLEKVKALIKEEIDKIIIAFRGCATEASSASGASAQTDASKSCKDVSNQSTSCF